MKGKGGGVAFKFNLFALVDLSAALSECPLVSMQKFRTQEMSQEKLTDALFQKKFSKTSSNARSNGK